MHEKCIYIYLCLSTLKKRDENCVYAGIVGKYGKNTNVQHLKVNSIVFNKLYTKNVKLLRKCVLIYSILLDVI